MAANDYIRPLYQFMNWVVAFITPILLDKSAFGAYFLFGGLALGTVLVLGVYMPETRGRSLENIQEAFSQHRAPDVRQYIGKIFPALIRRRALRNRHEDSGSGVAGVELRRASNTPDPVSGGILRMHVEA